MFPDCKQTDYLQEPITTETTINHRWVPVLFFLLLSRETLRSPNLLQFNSDGEKHIIFIYSSELYLCLPPFFWNINNSIFFFFHSAISLTGKNSFPDKVRVRVKVAMIKVTQYIPGPCCVLKGNRGTAAQMVLGEHCLTLKQFLSASRQDWSPAWGLHWREQCPASYWLGFYLLSCIPPEGVFQMLEFLSEL